MTPLLRNYETPKGNGEKVTTKGGAAFRGRTAACLGCPKQRESHFQRFEV